ncbi:MAG: hypothetical protein AAFO69_12205, partial [Bacteroidota bacterium]
MKYIFRDVDFKARSWKAAADGSDIDLAGGSRITFTFALIAKTLFWRRSDFVVVVRYLNDYKSPVKSFMLFFSELLLFVYVKLSRIELYWICHNIDRESRDIFPKMTRVRRSWVLAAASKIFVMDAHLTKYAKILFRKQAHKIQSTSFGRYKEELTIHRPNEVERVLDHQGLFYKGLEQKELLDIISAKVPEFDYTGFCAGKLIPKKVYFKEIPSLIAAGEAQGIKILMIVISDISPRDEPELHNYLKGSENVIFVNSLMKINAYKLAGSVDFHWLGYNDISIPYSIYVASSVKKIG